MKRLRDTSYFWWRVYYANHRFGSRRFLLFFHLLFGRIFCIDIRHVPSSDVYSLLKIFYHVRPRKISSPAPDLHAAAFFQLHVYYDSRTQTLIQPTTNITLWGRRWTRDINRHQPLRSRDNQRRPFPRKRRRRSRCGPAALAPRRKRPGTNAWWKTGR